MEDAVFTTLSKMGDQLLMYHFVAACKFFLNVGFAHKKIVAVRELTCTGIRPSQTTL